MNPGDGYVTPDAGRHRPVSLDAIRDLPDPAPWPNEFEDADELTAYAPAAAAMASCVILAMAEAMPPADREAIFHLFRPNDLSLRQRADVAGVAPNTIKTKALRYRAAMQDGLHTPPSGDPL